jgi:hypothetical protein
MASRHSTPAVGMFEQKIERLKEELYALRSFVIQTLPPEPLATLLQHYVSGNTPSVLDQIVATAVPLQQPFGSDQAVCPLCKARSSAPYSEGFTVPEGLERHLSGSYNAVQCEVMKAAFELRRHRAEHLRKSDEIKRRYSEQKAAERAQRPGPLFKTGPECTGELKDEALGKDHGLRAEGKMQSVQATLESMGFEAKSEGRLRSYVRAWNDLVVFADPRVDDRIRFNVFKGVDLVTSFELLDTSKDPRKKLEARLLKCEQSQS